MGRMMWKNLWRNKRRTLLTASGVAVSLFLLTSLTMLYQALSTPYQGADTTPRMMVRRKSGIVFNMPMNYYSRVKEVPGVAAATPMNWFGGYWRERENTFANFAVDADTVFDVVSVAHLPPDQLRAFKQERTAAVAGRQVAEKYHWKIGDRITLLGSPYGVTPELTLRGIFSGGPEDHFYFHYKYLNELLGGHWDQVSLFWIRLDRRDLAPRVSAAIDGMFRDTPAETKTESENDFLLSFVSLLGNVKALLMMIGGAVAFAILLIVANTMAMSVRERLPEAAILRTLGFRPRQILGLFMGESLLLTMGGGLLGILGAKAMFDALRLTKVSAFVWADMRVRPAALAFCLAISFLIAVVASGLPAYRAARTRIAEALRYVG
jgi:putative ABC transport system permease protein